MIIVGIILSVFGIGFFCWLLFTLAVYALPFFAGLSAGLAASALAAPMTKINIVLKNQAGKPVDHASVVVRFVQGHSVSSIDMRVVPSGCCLSAAARNSAIFRWWSRATSSA